MIPRAGRERSHGDAGFVAENGLISPVGDDVLCDPFVPSLRERSFCRSSPVKEVALRRAARHLERLP